MTKEGGAGSSATTGTAEASSHRALWHTRSWSWVASHVWEGLQASCIPGSPRSFGDCGKQAETTSDPSSSSSSSVPPPADGWGCLAGALLTTCSILEKQQRAHQQAHGGFSSPTTATTAGTTSSSSSVMSSPSMHGSSASSSSPMPGSAFAMGMEKEGEETTGWGTTRSPPHRAVIVVLSEEWKATSPTGTTSSSPPLSTTTAATPLSTVASPSSASTVVGRGVVGRGSCTMATECGFAIAATTLVKRSSTTLHSFGRPYTTTTTTSFSSSSASPNASVACRASLASLPTVALGGAGAERMLGLVHSLRGITAETFSAASWGVLLSSSPWQSLVCGGRRRGALPAPPLWCSSPVGADYKAKEETPVDPRMRECGEEEGVRGKKEVRPGLSTDACTSAAQGCWRTSMQWKECRAYGGREERADERLAHHYVVSPITLSPEAYTEQLLRQKGEEAEKEIIGVECRRDHAESGDGTSSSSPSSSNPVAERNASGSRRRCAGSCGTDTVASGYTVWLCPRCMSTVSPNASMPTPHPRRDSPMGTLCSSGNDTERDSCHRHPNEEIPSSFHPSSSGGSRKRLREGMKEQTGPPNGFSLQGNSKRTSPLQCCFCGA